MSRHRGLTLRRLTVFLALPLAMACSSEGRSHKSVQGHALGAPTLGAGSPLSVEQLAAKSGCGSPNVQIDADELRQAICQTPRGRYIITSFATEKGKRDWLDDAQSYGGAYLVGNRWVVIASPDLLSSLHGQLGGQMEMPGH
ncbi:hypothetical protein Pmi06nite_68940 [Planotetraspora mira]|uniref:Lipoprotein n=1 Tax=Planotetraspora mira TaxID=58121 RepID=A0A8J3TWC4_9ACTN|nr:hypothetical protein Pmi06nite_68940 [Planotetraspora mira]